MTTLGKGFALFFRNKTFSRVNTSTICKWKNVFFQLNFDGFVPKWMSNLTEHRRNGPGADQAPDNDNDNVDNDNIRDNYNKKTNNNSDGWR